jgi:2-polyprenyl-3-methyl-5-hydroxy-6-metoxy-1,4-benzoquinol methylase
MQAVHNFRAKSPYNTKTDPWSSHSLICERLRKYSPGTRVLDIGAATGILVNMCADYDFIWRGIEPNPEWAEIAASNYLDILCSTLSQSPENFLQNNDVVICADVLEHMAYPERELLRLVSLQNDKTTFLISVPNVANLWIRLNLLFGRFDYTDRGILDYTHLRFFTHRTLLKMINSSGLKIKAINVTPIPLNLINPFFVKSALGRLIHNYLARLTSIIPTLLGYQFVVEAENVNISVKREIPND